MPLSPSMPLQEAALRPDAAAGTFHAGSAAPPGERSARKRSRPPTPINAHIMEFEGSGLEYFRIWLVNLLLTIVTLSLYTPFARRRTVAYFMNHTMLAGDAFEFVAEKRKMFFGFLLVLALSLANKLAQRTGHDVAATLLILGLAALAPYLWASAMRFRLGNTRWRGLRLHFLPNWRQIYIASWPVFLIALLWIAFAISAARSFDDEPAAKPPATQQVSPAAARKAPAQADRAPASGEVAPVQLGRYELADAEAGEEDEADEDTPPAQRAPRLSPDTVLALLGGFVLAFFLSLLCLIRLDYNYKRLLILRTFIGHECGRWKPRYAQFVGIWMRAIALLFACYAAVGALLYLIYSSSPYATRHLGFSFTGILLLVLLPLFLLFVASLPALAYRQAAMFNLMWNNIGISQMARFKATLSVPAYVLLRVKNTVLNLVTLGFYRPFARVSEYAMRVNSVTMYLKGELDDITGRLLDQQEHGLGDAIADAVGLDFVS